MTAATAWTDLVDMVAERDADLEPVAGVRRDPDQHAQHLRVDGPGGRRQPDDAAADSVRLPARRAVAAQAATLSGRRRARLRQRFRGAIAGTGSTSGVRVVVGHWHDTPLGAFSDAMVETAAGGGCCSRRTGRRPTSSRRRTPSTRSGSRTSWSPARRAAGRSARRRWSLDLRLGRRTPLGALLRCVPARRRDQPRLVRADRPGRPGRCCAGSAPAAAPATAAASGTAPPTPGRSWPHAGAFEGRGPRHHRPRRPALPLRLLLHAPPPLGDRRGDHRRELTGQLGALPERRAGSWGTPRASTGRLGALQSVERAVGGTPRASYAPRA